MPVTTSRQSRGLLDTNVIAGRSEDMPARIMRESEDDDDPMDGSITELSDTEDEDYRSVRDEHESDASEGESNHEESDGAESDDNFEVTPPVAKRRKLMKASSSKSPAKSKRTRISHRVQGRLQDMLSLPFDVLFLIFAELGPMELVHLARTSKALRQVLMSRKSMSVWIAARRNATLTKVPDPPEDMSEPAWALLLFGPAVCSHCSAKNVHRVDFALRRRLCARCKTRNLVFLNQFQSHCPDLKECVMSLLPYTKSGGWSHGPAANSRFYWKPDLYEMGKRLAELEEDRDAGKPGARQRLRSFRADNIILADAIVESCAELEKWAAEEANAQTCDAQERRDQRRKVLKERILAVGYDSADIDYIGMSAVPGANICKPLTEGAWRRIKTKVEISLSNARQARLDAERRRREMDYSNKAEGHYLGILRQILPIQRVYLPAISQARELSCFRELVDPDRDVQPDEWEQAGERLTESISEWVTVHRDRYTSMLPSYIHDTQVKSMEFMFVTDPSIDLLRHEASGGLAGQLDLATSVFRCASTMSIWIGRDACHAWKLKGELEFVDRGAKAVHALLRELQLDPLATTASMLDQLDRRFVCTSCPTDLVQFIHSWRSYVVHFIEHTEIDHPDPQWRVVSSEVERLDDGVWPFPRRRAWVCNHCSDYASSTSLQPFRSVLTKEEAVQHAQTVHNIDNFMLDVDLFSVPLFV